MHKKITNSLRLNFLCIVVLILMNGCKQHRPINLSVAKKRLEIYHECGQYERDLEKIVRRSICHFSQISSKHKSVVIFDIDDTVLSDYAREKNISFGYIPKLSHEWVLQANAPAIPQVKCLYDHLVKRGFHIIFLTGRKHDEYEATIKNLRAEGFASFDRLIVRQPDELNLTARAYKTIKRKQLVKEGYRIVGCIGDQWSDLKGGNTGYQVKLPNFRYELP